MTDRASPHSLAIGLFSSSPRLCAEPTRFLIRFAENGRAASPEYCAERWVVRRYQALYSLRRRKAAYRVERRGRGIPQAGSWGVPCGRSTAVNSVGQDRGRQAKRRGTNIRELGMPTDWPAGRSTRSDLTPPHTVAPTLAGAHSAWRVRLRLRPRPLDLPSRYRTSS